MTEPPAGPVISRPSAAVTFINPGWFGSVLHQQREWTACAQQAGQPRPWPSSLNEASSGPGSIRPVCPPTTRARRHPDRRGARPCTRHCPDARHATARRRPREDFGGRATGPAGRAKRPVMHAAVRVTQSLRGDLHPSRRPPRHRRALPGALPAGPAESGT